MLPTHREEKTGGAFFEGRFKSVAILDDESLLAVCAYIDLNPVAASIAEVPETSKYTSIKQRVEQVQQQGRTDDLLAAKDGRRGGLRARRRGWRRGCGSVRSRIAGGSIRHVRGWSRDSRWATTCCW